MINVIGMGYIGLPTALMLSSAGYKIVGTDIDRECINKLNNKQLTFSEPKLDEIFKDSLDKDITFTTEYQKTDFYIVTVPTPYNECTKKIDPKYIILAISNILKNCEIGTILVLESTVPPNTIANVVVPLIEENGWIVNEDIFLVHAPERILPGNMINELKENPRIVGADSFEIAQRVKKVYSSFCSGEIVCTDIRTAEMTKVVENTYRAINIAFANELQKIAKYDNLDVHEIIRIANMHPRVDILSPGPGVGGHCIPIDPWFLVGDYPRLTKLISTSLEINESMPDQVLQRIEEIMAERAIKSRGKVGIYGLTYKADVDDVRESPTLQMFKKMEKYFSKPFRVYDPMLKKKIVDSQELSFEKFLNESELIVIMTDHTHLITNTSKFKGKIILDTRNILPSAYHL
ncbi:nucleotide sugar dehydrogenase [Enterococcus faecium]